MKLGKFGDVYGHRTSLWACRPSLIVGSWDKTVSQHLKYLTSLKYISYGVEHLIGLAPKLSKMSRTHSYLFGTSFYGENKLYYFIYQKCSDLNCTILESNLGNVLLTNFDSFSKEALKQGPCMCSTFKSFLVISANVPCMYYVQPLNSLKRYVHVPLGAFYVKMYLGLIRGTCTY